MTPRVAVVIPAYRPGPELQEVVRRLAPLPVIVVDDGSGAEYAAVFDGLKVVRHERNRGKGAALKTGFGHVLREFADVTAVVTADADGQHAPPDILRVAEAASQPGDALVLGVRHFGPGVPLRSRFGNRLTRSLLTLVLGQRLQDTQTGLRAIPARLLPRLLQVSSNGYEFELDMLIAARHAAVPFREIPIATIYRGRNEGSHFNPLLDSLKIYFVLLRFTMVSLLTAAIDNTVFLTVYPMLGSILGSQACGRLAGVAVNYLLARRAVFLTGEPHRRTLPRFLLLVAGSGLLSYGLIRFLHGVVGLPVLPSKLFAEGALFMANFLIQRDWVFRQRSP